jgi:hypothetical protein
MRSLSRPERPLRGVVMNASVHRLHEHVAA